MDRIVIQMHGGDIKAVFTDNANVEILIVENDRARDIETYWLKNMPDDAKAAIEAFEV